MYIVSCTDKEFYTYNAREAASVARNWQKSGLNPIILRRVFRNGKIIGGKFNVTGTVRQLSKKLADLNNET